MTQETLENYAHVWVIIHDGKISPYNHNEYGIGIVCRLHFMTLQQVLENGEIYNSMHDALPDDIPEGVIAAKFKIFNFTYFEGQMTFPETGQYDIEPGWHFDTVFTGWERAPLDTKT